MPMPMYRPGELLEKIDIKRESLTADGMGGNTRVFNTVHSVRAHVRPMSGNEKNDFDTIVAAHSYLVVIRYMTDVFESDRVVWRGEEFNIRSISDKGPRSLYLELMVEKGVAQ